MNSRCLLMTINTIHFLYAEKSACCCIKKIAGNSTGVTWTKSRGTPITAISWTHKEERSDNKTCHVLQFIYLKVRTAIVSATRLELLKYELWKPMTMATVKLPPKTKRHFCVPLHYHRHQHLSSGISSKLESITWML